MDFLELEIATSFFSPICLSYFFTLPLIFCLFVVGRIMLATCFLINWFNETALCSLLEKINFFYISLLAYKCVGMCVVCMLKLKFQIEAALSLPPGCTYALNPISITPSDVMRRDGWQCAQKKNTSTHTYCHMDLLQNRPKRTKITKWWCWRKNMPNAISQIKPNQYQLLRLCRRFVYF